MHMRPLLTLFVLLAALGPGAARAAHGAPLQFCYEDVPQPPWTMPDGSGLNIELLKRVEALTGERFVLVRRPWLRCVEETKLGVMDGMIGAADSPERRQFTLPPMLPDGSADARKALYLDNVSLVMRVGSRAAWDGKELHNPRGLVVAQRGYFVAGLMRERGQRVLEQVKSADEALRLVVSGSADVAVLMEHSVHDLLRNDPRFRGHLKMAPIPFTVFPFHLLIGRLSYEKNPARIEAVWNAIATVRSTPEYRKLEASRTRRPRPD
jgi:polar amino acid transport system substrate-binding protein